jgi:hypothetical protein
VASFCGAVEASVVRLGGFVTLADVLGLLLSAVAAFFVNAD